MGPGGLVLETFGSVFYILPLFCLRLAFMTLCIGEGEGRNLSGLSSVLPDELLEIWVVHCGLPYTKPPEHNPILRVERGCDSREPPRT